MCSLPIALLWHLVSRAQGKEKGSDGGHARDFGGCCTSAGSWDLPKPPPRSGHALKQHKGAGREVFSGLLGRGTGYRCQDEGYFPLQAKVGALSWGGTFRRWQASLGALRILLNS